jgi:proline iminopeptidase
MSRTTAPHSRLIRPVPDDSFHNRVWRAPQSGTVATVGVAALSGFIVALTMPRGPITEVGALALMAGTLVVGFGAGIAMRSRWAMLLAPVTLLAAFELGRWGTPGPTVSSLQLDSAYGVLAFVLGRILIVLTGLLPMVLGASVGAALARHLSDGDARPRSARGRAWLYTRRLVTALGLVGLAALAAIIVQPASTPAILGPDGRPLPGSIATLEEVQLGGHEQWIMIRGHSTEKPVLLSLTGGPGQSDLPYARVLWQDLERDFVVVDWDQRGTGKSYPALDPASTLTLEQAIADTVELTEYLRARFDERKIYLHGESWGSTLGVLAVQRRPDLYHALIGSGQMVSQRETDRRLYQDVLDLAARTGNDGLARTMRAVGEPPYPSIFANALVMAQYDHLYKPFTLPESTLERGPVLAREAGPWGVFGREYSLVEKVGVLRGLMDMFSVMYPQLQGLDFRTDVPRLEVPYYMLDGAAELTARRDLALEWFGQLDAPLKRRITFDNGAHSVGFEHFEAFHQLMIDTVLPETYPADAPPRVDEVGPVAVDAQTLATFFDKTMPTQLDDRHIPGATVAVVRGDEVVFARGYGWADVERQVPVVADRTLFHIGSNTKLFTWTAVMQLVEQGKLDLDADVNTYLDFRIPATYPEPITLRHLMTHTAGFENRDFGMIAPSPEGVTPLAQWLPAHLPARVRPPGIEAGYSNYGTALAGHIVERTAGMPYEEYVEQHLLGPLDMQRSTVRQHVPSGLAPDVARGYVSEGSRFREELLPTYQGYPAGAIRATATDVGHFMSAHLQDGRFGDSRILEDGTARLMRETAFRPDPRLNGLAHGFWEMDRNGARVLGHIGSAAPIHYSLLALLPDEGVGLFVAYNGDTARPLTVNNELLATFMDHFYPAPANEITTPPETASRVSQYTGEYRRNNFGGSETTVEKVRRILGEGNRRVDDAGDRTLDVGVGGGSTRFVEVAPDFFREVGGPDMLLFRRNQAGDVTKAVFSGSPVYTYERLPVAQTPMFNQALLAAATATFASTLLIAAVAWAMGRWRPTGTDRGGLARVARLTAGLTAVLNLAFLAVLVLVLVDPTTLMGDFSRLRVLLVLPLIGLALTGAVVVFAALAWRQQQWSLPARLHYTAFALVSVAFVWFLGSWNLIGFSV